MPRIFVPLKFEERDALLLLAEREHRDPRRQAALMIRRMLERQGLLKPISNETVEHNREKSGGKNEN